MGVVYMKKLIRKVANRFLSRRAGVMEVPGDLYREGARYILWYVANLYRERLTGEAPETDQEYVEYRLLNKQIDKDLRQTSNVSKKFSRRSFVQFRLSKGISLQLMNSSERSGAAYMYEYKIIAVSLKNTLPLNVRNYQKQKSDAFQMLAHELQHVVQFETKQRGLPSKELQTSENPFDLDEYDFDKHHLIDIEFQTRITDYVWIFSKILENYPRKDRLNILKEMFRGNLNKVDPRYYRAEYQTVKMIESLEDLLRDSPEKWKKTIKVIAAHLHKKGIL